MRTFPTRMRSRRRLLVFARLPQEGRVKTRLAQSLGGDAALAVYKAMLVDVLARLEPLRSSISIEILWTAEGEVSGTELREHFGDHELSRQAGETLGERLQMAFSERIFFHEAETVIAVGVDEPALTAADVSNAFDLLESCEWVVGPAMDGGYWLIGCRGGAFRSSVFRDIPWGTSDVLESTLAAIRAMKRTLALLPQRRDVDDLEDLRTLADLDMLPPNTAAVARKIAPDKET